MELAERIKKLRIIKSFSQEELSEKSGLSLRTIQRIENGESQPRGDTLILLTKAFDIPADYFDKGTLEEKSNPEKANKIKFPWFIISFTIVGCALGVIIGIVIILSKILPLNDAISFILVVSIAILFLGIGMFIGKLLEEKFNK